MKIELLRVLRCPSCHSSDELVCACQPIEGEIIDGELRCNACRTSYAIRHGIPRFVDGDNYAQSFGFQWNLYAKTQLDSHTGHPISRNRLFETTRWPKDLSGQLVLETGCGAGRFTEILLSAGAKVYSFDYSVAVDANARNNAQHPNLHLFQADIFNIPARAASFDKVLCLGVLQHTPDPERALKSLAQYVRPGGELVIDSYQKSLTRILHWKYVLRPLTKRIKRERLHSMISRVVPIMMPIAKTLRRLGGRAGARMVPILEYSHFELPYELEREWTVLDTFDMYSPAHDHPQSAGTLLRWLKEAKLVDTQVYHAPNGLAGRGRRAEQSSPCQS